MTERDGLPYVITVTRWVLYMRHWDGEVNVWWSHAKGQTLFKTRREARAACKEANAKQMGWTSVGSRYFVGKVTIVETTEHAR